MKVKKKKQHENKPTTQTLQSNSHDWNPLIYVQEG